MKAYRPLLAHLSPPEPIQATLPAPALANGSATPMIEDGEAEEGELEEEGEAPKQAAEAAALLPGTGAHG